MILLRAILIMLLICEAIHLRDIGIKILTYKIGALRKYYRLEAMAHSYAIIGMILSIFDNRIGMYLCMIGMIVSLSLAEKTRRKEW